MIWLILYIWITILVIGTMGIVLFRGKVKWQWHDFITLPLFALLWPVSVPLFFIWVALN